MADKLLIVMVNTDPHNPSELGAPFFQATVAAAMEFEVEVILTGRAGELAKKGVAENLFVQEGSSKSVYGLHEGCPRGGRLVQSLHPDAGPLGRRSDPRDRGDRGGAYVISEAMDDDTVTFTY
jgi:uncharacterized protein